VHGPCVALNIVREMIHMPKESIGLLSGILSVGQKMKGGLELRFLILKIGAF
jgi:hypothetical protein